MAIFFTLNDKSVIDHLMGFLIRLVILVADPTLIVNSVELIAILRVVLDADEFVARSVAGNSIQAIVVYLFII
jgi:hypothetical protein